ncbi:hypothetical protein [Dactylosporangium sp. NPDC048998]
MSFRIMGFAPFPPVLGLDLEAIGAMGFRHNVSAIMQQSTAEHPGFP